MVKNTRGGNKAKKAKNNSCDINSRPLRLKDKTIDSDEIYAQVISLLGGATPRVQVLCENGFEKRCVIRGKFRKKIWVRKDDILLIIYDKSKNDGTGEVVHVFNPTEVNKLHSLGELDEYTFSKPEDLKNDDTFEVENYLTVDDNLNKTNYVSDFIKISNKNDIYNLDNSDNDIDIDGI
jgi:initiation factor 1A